MSALMDKRRWMPYGPGDYPADCSKLIGQYFSVAFDKVAVIIALNGNEKELLVFRL